jgi:tRNA (guanine-N7-)-methyltransferase
MADHHHPIRSFVLREGRLTSAQERAFRDLWPRLGVDWQPGTTLDPEALFGPGHLTYLEIGFGNGETLAQMAAERPERRYLGVEVHRPGVGHLLLELERRGLTNVQGLPPASLEGVYLFFPDPWPKQRHHKRRILKPEFVDLLARVIRPGGTFHAATDWAPYAEQMLSVLDAATDTFTNTAPDGSYSPRPDDRPLTKFERRGQRLGHAVHDLVFRRR